MSDKRYYRVSAKCDKCGTVWVTRAKPKPKRPNHCINCNSTMTRVLDKWEVFL